jgi:hypothetical protein
MNCRIDQSTQASSCRPVFSLPTWFIKNQPCPDHQIRTISTQNLALRFQDQNSAAMERFDKSCGALNGAKHFLQLILFRRQEIISFETQPPVLSRSFAGSGT